MDENKKDDLSELEEIDIKPEENKLNTVEERLYNIDIRLQELDVKMDSLEVLMTDDDQYIAHYNEYNDLKKEIKTLEQERKNLKKNVIIVKEEEKTLLDKVSIWVIIYGVLMMIICFPLVSYNIWLDFTNVLINAFSDVLNTVSSNDKFLIGVIYVVLIYAMPLLLNLLSWLVYTYAVKNDTDKKVFKIIWIIQAVLCIGLMIYMGVNFFPVLL